MDILAVPYDLLHQCFYHSALLVDVHSVYRIGENREHSLQRIKLRAAENVFLGHSFQFSNVLLIGFYELPQLLNPRGHSRNCFLTAHFSDRINQRVNLFLMLSKVFSRRGKSNFILIIVVCQHFLALIELAKELRFILVQLLELFDDSAIEHIAGRIAV